MEEELKGQMDFNYGDKGRFSRFGGGNIRNKWRRKRFGLRMWHVTKGFLAECRPFRDWRRVRFRAGRRGFSDANASGTVVDLLFR